MLAYLRFVHLVPVGKIASLGLRRRRIAETPFQLLCDAIKVRLLCRECVFKDRCLHELHACPILREVLKTSNSYRPNTGIDL